MTKSELPVSSQFAGGTEKICGVNVCAVSTLLPMPGSSQAEEGLPVFKQISSDN